MVVHRYIARAVGWSVKPSHFHVQASPCRKEILLVLYGESSGVSDAGTHDFVIFEEVDHGVTMCLSPVGVKDLDSTRIWDYLQVR